MTRERGAAGWWERAAAQRWALVPLRLVVGYGFAAHGYAKLARGHPSFASILAAMDIPLPVSWPWRRPFSNSWAESP